MTKLLTFTFLTLVSLKLLATDVAFVAKIDGRAFLHYEGKVKILKHGDRLFDMSEVITEEGAQVTLADYYDHHYHLSGSGHVKFFNKMLELKRGAVWVQSYRDDVSFNLTTANANVSFKKGEAIVSFDTVKSRSQVLAISGDFGLENATDRFTKVDIRSGQFSFVDHNYNDGVPRVPTPIGESSFAKITRLFYDVSPMNTNTTRFKVASKKTKKRTPASTSSKWDFDTAGQAQKESQHPKDSFANEPRKSPVAPKKKQVRSPQSNDKDFIIIKRAPAILRGPSSFNKKNLYKKELKRLEHRKRLRNPRDYSKKSNVKVQVFGTKQYKPKKRKPASMPKKLKQSNVPDSALHPESNVSNEFDSSLVDAYKNQMRHSGEVNELINELKSYDQDYKQKH